MGNIDVCSIEHKAETHSFQSTLTKNRLVNRIQKGDGQKGSNAYFKCIFTVSLSIFQRFSNLFLNLKVGTLLTWFWPLSQDLMDSEEILKNVIITMYAYKLLRRLSNDFDVMFFSRNSIKPSQNPAFALLICILKWTVAFLF